MKHPEELHTGRGAAHPYSLHKSQRPNSTWHMDFDTAKTPNSPAAPPRPTQGLPHQIRTVQSALKTPWIQVYVTGFSILLQAGVTILLSGGKLSYFSFCVQSDKQQFDATGSQPRQ